MLAKTLVYQSAKCSVLVVFFVMFSFVARADVRASEFRGGQEILIGILYDDFDGSGDVAPRGVGNEFYIKIIIDRDGKIHVPDNEQEFIFFIKNALGEEYYNFMIGNFFEFYCYPVKKEIRDILIFTRFIRYLVYAWKVDEMWPGINGVEPSGYTFFEAGVLASKILSMIVSANGDKIENDSHGTDFCYNIDLKRRGEQ